jgi:hypothetical protein
MSLSRGVSSSKLGLVTILLALVALGVHASLRGLKPRQADSPATLSPLLTINGVASTVMKDSFSTGRHVMLTLVHTDDGRVYEVDTPHGEQYVGERVTWEVRSKVDESPASERTSSPVHESSIEAEVAHKYVTAGLCVVRCAMSVFHMCAECCRPIAVVLVNKLAAQASSAEGEARRLEVLPSGPKSLLIIRVGLVDPSTGASVWPDYCDEACVSVSCHCLSFA